MKTEAPQMARLVEKGSSSVGLPVVVIRETPKTWRVRSPSGSKEWTAYKTTFQLFRAAPSDPEQSKSPDASGLPKAKEVEKSGRGTYPTDIRAGEIAR